MRLISNDTAATPGMGRLSGSITALVTPFGNGRVDAALLARLCLRQIAAGTAGLVVCGSTGEAPALSDAEQRVAVGAVVKAVRGRVPVIAGCGAPSTCAAVERARDALRAGADALLCAPPPYVKPTQQGIAAHVQAVACVGLPIVLYDVPGRTGVAIADATVASLFEAGSIFALKDATGDLSRPARLRALAGPALLQFGGDDATAVAHLAMGGHGCISVTANLVPALCQALQHAWRQANLAELARLRDLLQPLNQALFQETNPIVVKAAMALAGLCGPELRLPLQPPAPPLIEAMKPLVDRAMQAEAALRASPRRTRLAAV